jgi:hypothetical protein
MESILKVIVMKLFSLNNPYTIWHLLCGCLRCYTQYTNVLSTYKIEIYLVDDGVYYNLDYITHTRARRKDGG